MREENVGFIYISLWLWCALSLFLAPPQTSYVPSSKATWAGNTSSFMVHFFPLAAMLSLSLFSPSTLLKFQCLTRKKMTHKRSFFKDIPRIGFGKPSLIGCFFIGNLYEFMLFYQQWHIYPTHQWWGFYAQSPGRLKNKRSSSWHLDKNYQIPR